MSNSQNNDVDASAYAATLEQVATGLENSAHVPFDPTITRMAAVDSIKTMLRNDEQEAIGLAAELHAAAVTATRIITDSNADKGTTPTKERY